MQGTYEISWLCFGKFNRGHQLIKKVLPIVSLFNDFLSFTKKKKHGLTIHRSR